MTSRWDASREGRMLSSSTVRVRPSGQATDHANWSKESQGRDLAQRARDTIAAAVGGGKHWTVEGVAQELGISGAHLHRLFKKHFHTTPRSFAVSIGCPTLDSGSLVAGHGECFRGHPDRWIMTSQMEDPASMGLFMDVEKHMQLLATDDQGKCSPQRSSWTPDFGGGSLDDFASMELEMLGILDFDGTMGDPTGHWIEIENILL